MDQDITDDELEKQFRSMPIWGEHYKLVTRIERLEHDVETFEENIRELQENLAKKKIEQDPPTQEEPPQKSHQNPENQSPEKARELETQGRKRFDKSILYSDKNLIKLKSKITYDEEVYVMYDAGKPWVRARVLSIFRKYVRLHEKPMIIIRVKIIAQEDIDAIGHSIIQVKKFEVARIQNHGTNLRVAKRVIAGRPKRMMPGIIARQPNDANNYRYLVMMDDGQDLYFRPDRVYPIFYQSTIPWNDIRHLQDFDIAKSSYLRAYFYSYPRRHLMNCDIGDDINLYRHKKIVQAKVLDIDDDIMRIKYSDGYEQNIYRGSPRLLLNGYEQQLKLALVNNVTKLHPEVVYSLAVYNEAGVLSLDEDILNCIEDVNSKFYITKSNRQTARKSTGSKHKKKKILIDDVPVAESDQIYDLTDEELSITKHKCSKDCLYFVPIDETGQAIKTENSVINIVDEFRNMSDLKVPLVLGWHRKLIVTVKYSKPRKQIIYIAPCGKIFKTLFDIKRYIAITNSKLDIDYFSFDRCITMNNVVDVEGCVYVENLAVDKKTGRVLENKFISVLNVRDKEPLPIDFTYSNEVVPHIELRKRNFTFNSEFKSSCDCEDDCRQRSTCACHRLNEDSAGKIAYKRGAVDDSCQYVHKRLMEQVNTGIFECNSGCKCSSKCSNRVVQNGIRYRLQIYKMPGHKGWGVITLDDIPEGAFICTYAAELLDDADMYGNCDVYYADLDYITVNEGQKEGYLDEEEKFDEGLELDEDDEENAYGERKNNEGENDKNGKVEKNDTHESNTNCNFKSKTNETNGKNRRVTQSVDSEDEGNSRMDLDEYDGPHTSKETQTKRPRGIDDDDDDDDDDDNSSIVDGTSISSLDIDMMVDPYNEDNDKVEKEVTPQARASAVNRYPKRKTRTDILDQYKSKVTKETVDESSANKKQSKNPGEFKRLHRLLKSHDYTLDARMQGNIGRFFNHSCSPNAYVQNVFIESHDLRFPVVAFFAHKTIKASMEITWNYNYKPGSIEGRRIDCECGAANCKGRIL